jgi:putative phosphoesterase
VTETDFKIALISDIHGNTWALEAVLEDLDRRGIQTVLNPGDSVYGPLDPAGTARLLMSRDFITVSGNQDRNIIENRNRDTDIPTMKYVLGELDDTTLEWLESLPSTRVTEEDIFLCHGTPEHDESYLIEQIGSGGVRLNNPKRLDALLTSVTQNLIVCGHSHVFRTVMSASGKLVVNAGSAGLPAYQDEEPFVHTMENGTPHARYGIITRTRGHIRIEQIALPYDWNRAADRAAENNRKDWQKWLLTGRA